MSKDPLSPRQLDTNASETAAFRSIDERPDSVRSTEEIASSSDYQRVFDALDAGGGGSGSEDDEERLRRPSRFKNTAKKVMAVQRLRQATLIRQRVQQRTHSHSRRASVTAQDLLGTIGEEIVDGGGVGSLVIPDRQDALVATQIEKVEKFYAPVEGELEEAEQDELQESIRAAAGRGEGLPLLSSQYGSVETLDDGDNEPTLASASVGKNWLSCLCRPCACFSLEGILGFLYRTVTTSVLVLIGLPLFLASWTLYYLFGNPTVDFLPDGITISWMFQFLGRQTVTLELARLTQWLLVDCIVLGTHLGIRLVGPFLSLFFIQGKGWPFVVAMWSVWDLFLLHGDDKFDNHWLYWTDIKVFSTANSGAFILDSNQYLRVLLAMLLAGIATAFKRLAVTVRFGRRQFSEFKPRLKKVLHEVVLLSEIASLAAQVDEIESIQSEIEAAAVRASTDRKGLATVKFKSERIAEYEAEYEAEEDESDTEDAQAEDTRKTVLGRRGGLSHSQFSSLSVKLSDMLDRWAEPVHKADRSLGVSIRDVLKFKRALSYMDDHLPFGEDYGPAPTRAESVASSDVVFSRLLKLANSKDSLPFSVLETLALNEDGKFDSGKIRVLRKLFRPDRLGQLNQIAFLQSCDSVYKQLRYFRASVGNASVIDQVLESIIDGIFFFVLTLLLLSLLQYNPWSLLLSLTSLLVSVSFALGPSLAKYVEGIFLIAVRRPFDLGDRIFFAGPETMVSVDITGFTYFVEDITIATTTLRHARTNEVSTINNWSIAGSRIVNCNRSPNALVTFEMTFHISILKDNKLKTFQTAMDTFVKDRPRLWHSIAVFRHDSIDPDNELVYFVMVVAHRQSWQDVARIKLNRADFVKYIFDVGDKLGVNVDTPPARRVLYQGGDLDQGGIRDYKRNLMKPSNILNISHRYRPTSFAEVSSVPGDTKTSSERTFDGGILPGE